ncbi:MAG TPA: hypothetical protein VGO71_11975 [Baekduia sp.]|nr:hypothetical protein [Baekduia sp.]
MIAAALGGAATAGLLHKPAPSGSSPVPVVSQTASATASSSLVRARLRTAVTELESVRRPMRDRLARARTAAERAKAAGAIAAAYRDAARVLAPVEQHQAAHSGPTVRLLRALRRDYATLARAASDNEAAAFASTGASISAHERALAGVLARRRAAT